MPWQVMWCLPGLFHVFTSGFLLVCLGGVICSWAPGGIPAMGQKSCMRMGSAWSPYRYTKNHSCIFSCASNTAKVTHIGVMVLDWGVEFGLQSVPGSLLSLCLNVLCQASQKHPHAVTTPLKQVHPSVHPQKNAHFSTLRKNLLSPELVKSKSSSSLPKFFAWVRSWGTEWMWNADTPKPALPQELFTSDQEWPKVLFLEMWKLFGKRKKPWKFSFPLETKLSGIEDSWRLNWR